MHPNDYPSTIKGVKMIISKINKNIFEIIIDRPKVNAINNEMLDLLENELKAAENDINTNVILLRGEGSFFSFGLDIPEFLDFEKEDLKKSIYKLLNICKKFYLSNKITIASINGHATGGGCMLAISTDFKFMVNQRAKIALNEINIGLSLFSSTISMLEKSIGLNKAKKILLTGELFSPDDAKHIGLVDELYSREELYEKSSEFGYSFNEKSNLIIKTMKNELQKSSNIELNDSDKSIDDFLDIFYLPETQKRLKEIKIKS